MKSIKENRNLLGSQPITFTRIISEREEIDDFLESDLKSLCETCRTRLDLVNEIIHEYEESFIIDSDDELVYIEDDDTGNINVKDAIDTVMSNNLVYLIYTLTEFDEPDFLFCFCKEEVQYNKIIYELKTKYKRGYKVLIVGYFS